MQVEQSNSGEANESREIFTVSSQVVPPTSPQLTVNEALSQGKDGSPSEPKPHVLVGEVDFASSRSRRENDAGSAQIVFGRERPQVLQLLRERTAALYIFLKQKFHTRTLNIDQSSSRDPDTPQLQTRTSTHTTDMSVSPLTANRDFIASNLNASGRRKTHSQSTESDKGDPVQNLVQTIPGSKPSRKMPDFNTQYGDDPVQKLLQTILSSKPSRKKYHSDTQYGDDPAQNLAERCLTLIPSMEITQFKTW